MRKVVDTHRFFFSCEFLSLCIIYVWLDLEEVEEWKVQGGALYRRAGRYGDRRVHSQLADLSGYSFTGGYGG